MDPDGNTAWALAAVEGIGLGIGLGITAPEAAVIIGAAALTVGLVAGGIWAYHRARAWYNARQRSAKSQVLRNIKRGWYPHMSHSDPEGPRFPKRMKWYYKAAWWAANIAQIIDNHSNSGK